MKEVEKFRELRKEFVVCTNLLYKSPRIIKTVKTIMGWACGLDGDRFMRIFGRKM
jgi:hypothetical protein